MDATLAVPGCKAKLTINGVDVSGESNSFSLTVTKEMNEVTSFGNCTMVKVAGQRDWNISGGGVYTQDTTSLQETLWTAYESETPVPIVFSPNGGTVGDVQYTGNAHVSEMGIEAEPNSPVAVSLTLEGSDILTRTVVV